MPNVVLLCCKVTYIAGGAGQGDGSDVDNAEEGLTSQVRCVRALKQVSSYFGDGPALKCTEEPTPHYMHNINHFLYVT